MQYRQVAAVQIEGTNNLTSSFNILGAEIDHLFSNE